MAKSFRRLTALGVSKLKLKPSKITGEMPKRVRFADGENLFFNIDANGSRSWSFIYSRNGKSRELGCGRYPDVALQVARDKAAEYRAMLTKGLDPKEEKQRSRRPVVEPGSVTFGAAMERLLTRKASEWTSERNVRQIGALMRKHCRKILDLPAEQIRTQEVFDIVGPVYKSTPAQGSRLLHLIEATFTTAYALGDLDARHRPPNPARWKDHFELLLSKRKAPTHHVAMHYRELPRFVAQLRDRQGEASTGAIDVAACACEFLILTAARSGEVLGARWDEVDFDERVWNVPAHRMKAHRPHSTPLADAAMRILERMPRVDGNPYIFPGRGPNRGSGKTPGGRRHPKPKESFGPLTPRTFERLLDRMGCEATPHGFRSSFRDFAGNETEVAREIAEAALAHAVGDATEQAYRRETALERRRVLMDLWAAYLERGPADNVLEFRQRA
jgi:integrase